MSNFLESNDLFSQTESLTIGASELGWKTLLKLEIPPGKKLYINHIYAEASSAASPEAYYNIVLNGNKIVHNFGSHTGALLYYFWGKVLFVLTKNDTFEIQVRGNSAATVVEASVVGLLFPLEPETKPIE